jgi:hypothetical protein
MTGTRYLQGSNALGTAGVTFLAVAVLICLVAFAPMLWTAVREAALTQANEDPRGCVTIKSDADRLKCFETRVIKPTPPPAHGAKVPAEVFGNKSEMHR